MKYNFTHTVRHLFGLPAQNCVRICCSICLGNYYFFQSAVIYLRFKNDS